MSYVYIYSIYFFQKIKETLMNVERVYIEEICTQTDRKKRALKILEDRDMYAHSNKHGQMIHQRKDCYLYK